MATLTIADVFEHGTNTASALVLVRLAAGNLDRAIRGVFRPDGNGTVTLDYRNAVLRQAIDVARHYGATDADIDAAQEDGIREV